MTDEGTDASRDLQRRAAELQDVWCTAVDTSDLEAIQALFAPGGRFLTRGRLMDAAERAQFFTELWAESPSRSTHVCRDVRATHGQDGIQVTARLAATFVLPDGSIRVAWGHYDDLATETPEGLRFLSKEVTLERVELHTEQRHLVRPELDHTAIAVPEGELARLVELFADILGGTLASGGLEPVTGLRSAHVTFPGGGKVELLEPTRSGPVDDFLHARGSGVHHLTVLVDDVDDTVARLDAAGFRAIGRSEPTTSWHEAYVHPRDAAGCLIQLVRAGAGYGNPVPVTIEDILGDRWTWVDRRPQPVSD